MWRLQTLPFESYETGKMQFGTANPGDEDYDSLTDISVSPEGDMTEIRIPWQLLNIKDPSLKDAMGDMWKAGIEGKKKIDAINIGLYETEGKESSDITKLFFYSLTETLWYRPLTGEGGGRRVACGACRQYGKGDWSVL